jgi:hypothetical protein
MTSPTQQARVIMPVSGVASRGDAIAMMTTGNNTLS